MSSQHPKISVIVPAYNSETTMAACLDGLLRQDYENFEIIIVDDGSTDTTAQICRKNSIIRLIEVSNGGPSRARNIGAKAATGNIIAFTDSDCIVEQNWLTELAKGYSTETIGSVGGNQISPKDETPFGQLVQKTLVIVGFATSYMKTNPTVGETAHNPSCNSSYRTAVFEEVGGFDESLWPGEDVDLDHRIQQKGYTLIRNPKALVRHYRPQSLKGVSAMMQRYGGSAYTLLRRYGFFRTLHYIPFISLGILGGLIAMAVYKPSLFLVVAAAAVLALVFFFFRYTLSKQSTQMLLLILFIILHWHYGFFKQSLQPYKKLHKLRPVNGE